MELKVKGSQVGLKTLHNSILAGIADIFKVIYPESEAAKGKGIKDYAPGILDKGAYQQGQIAGLRQILRELLNDM